MRLESMFVFDPQKTKVCDRPIPPHAHFRYPPLLPASAYSSSPSSSSASSAASSSSSFSSSSSSSSASAPSRSSCPSSFSYPSVVLEVVLFVLIRSCCERALMRWAATRPILSTAGVSARCGAEKPTKANGQTAETRPGAWRRARNLPSGRPGLADAGAIGP